LSLPSFPTRRSSDLIVSITWTLHIILYMIVPNGFIIMPFLNTMIKGLHFVFPPLGVAAYAFFAFYLLIATIVGNITIWSKIPCRSEEHTSELQSREN